MVKFPIISLISLGFTLLAGRTEGSVAFFVPGTGAAAFQNVDEDTAAAVTLTTLSAFTSGNQTDGSAADIVAYGIENQAGTVLFAVDPPSGNLSLAPGSVLDYETTQTYELTVTARDNADPESSATGTLTVRVVDVNDNEPAFQQASYTVVLPSASTAGSTVGTYVATDADGTSPNNDIAIYRIASGDDTQAKFSMDPTTGVITTTGATLDPAVKPSYDLAIQAVDGGTPALTGNAVVQICLDTPCQSGHVDFLRPGRGAAAMASVAENVAVSVDLYSLLATTTGSQSDGSAAVIEAYGIVNQPTPAVFQVDPQTGVIRLATGTSLDYETTDQYDVVVTARNNAVVVASATATLTVRVTDVNDNSPQFSQQSYTATVASSAGSGVSVGTFTANDNDGTAPNNVISAYSIVPVDATPAKFSMNPSTGEITTTGVALNTTSKYDLVIQAVDGGTPPLTGNALVEICLDTPCPSARSGENRLVPFTVTLVMGILTASLLILF